MAYGDTDVFDLGSGMQSVAMVFERAGGLWKLATAVNRPSGGWPALCTQGTPPAASRRARARQLRALPWPGC